jgi:hypothetical protein
MASSNKLDVANRLNLGTTCKSCDNFLLHVELNFVPALP